MNERFLIPHDYSKTRCYRNIYLLHFYFQTKYNWVVLKQWLKLLASYDYILYYILRAEQQGLEVAAENVYLMVNPSTWVFTLADL